MTKIKGFVCHFLGSTLTVELKEWKHHIKVLKQRKSSYKEVKAESSLNNTALSTGFSTFMTLNPYTGGWKAATE